MSDTAKPIDKTYANLRMNQILEALESLIETTPYSAVTVRMICKRAGISRPTFYRYFKDKDEIIQWYWDRSGEKHLKHTRGDQCWYEGNLLMLREFKKHARLMTKVLAHDEGVNSCIKHGYRRRVSYLRTAISDDDPLALTDDLDFEIRFFADAESRAIAQWVEKGMIEKPEVVARRIEGCVPAKLRAIVESIAARD